MALLAYETATQRLLQSPQAPITLYDLPSIDSYINTARQQLAMEGECVRQIGTITTDLGSREYDFDDDITGLNPWVQSVVHVRRVTINTVTGGQSMLNTHAWPWFDYFYINNPNPPNGAPARWAQYGQGVTGTIWVDPIPDSAYILNADCVCVPIKLIDDTTVEGIPYPWTDAIPYFAAYLALLSAQAPARTADADRMLARYEEFVQRARQFSNPDLLRGQYLQSDDVTLSQKLALQAQQGSR
jgi:hypothetical protein